MVRDPWRVTLRASQDTASKPRSLHSGSQKARASGRDDKSMFVGMGELLVAEGVDGVELGGTRSRIEAGGETDTDGEDERAEDEPPGDGREFDGIEILALEIDVGAERDGAAE